MENHMPKIYWLAILIVTIILFSLALAKYINKTPAHLYKVISVENWEQSKNQDHLSLSQMDSDFIHFSTEKQLDRIINKFWKNEPEFFILKVNVKQLPGKFVFESNPGGTSKYYHLYNGFIPTSSIVSSSKTIK